jgi:signal peptidase I
MGGDGENAPKAKPGWYPDDSQPESVRYWDGGKWTDQRAPAPPGGGEPPSSPRHGSRRLWIAAGAAVVLVAAIVLVVVLAGGGGDGGNTQTYEVPSASMEPTFKIGDDLTIDLDTAGSSDLSVGDVVAFRPPVGAETASECGVLVRGMQPVESGEACPRPTSQPSNQVFLKRVVAVGGDTLSIKDGEAVLDGEEQDEGSFTKPCGGGYECNLPKTIKIPPGFYFTLGDNRGESDDSRYWGPVPAAWILGTVDE